LHLFLASPLTAVEQLLTTGLFPATQLLPKALWLPRRGSYVPQSLLACMVAYPRAPTLAPMELSVKIYFGLFLIPFVTGVAGCIMRTGMAELSVANNPNLA